jgi:outer membrane protein assembly factor BamE (lipoprotein component of BamABCDE complex)
MKLKILLCGVVLIAVAVICLVPLLARDAVPVAKYNQVAVGMTKTNVQSIMGVPARIRHDSPQTTTFFYGGLLRLRWNSMEIYFGSDDRVTGKFDDD